MFYSEAELYAGSTQEIIGYDKKGRPKYGAKPLDPGLMRASMNFHYPKPAPAEPAAPQQTRATLASTGQSVRRPKQKRSRTTLSSLRIRPRKEINQMFGGGTAGTGLNVGSFG